jgi:hypothetical protein
MLGGIEVLASDLRPLRTQGLRQYSSAVAKYIVESAEAKIVTGYFGVESVIELIGLLEANPLDRDITFTVGMAAFDGLTQTQLEALRKLDLFLTSNRQGQVLISVSLPVHSKIALFVASPQKQVVIVGSSNFTNLVSGVRQFETDLAIDGLSPEGKTVCDLIRQIENAADPLPLAEHRIKLLKAKLSSLAAEQGVEKSEQSKSEIVSSFILPIKTEPRSSLNAYFGKGRQDSKGRVLPRPWYEVELIVSKSVTTQADYPKRDEVITVVTDDGWKFDCHCTGDYAKNFRSFGNLEILGKWLKGRLEESGALKPGSPVTLEVLEKYGNDKIVLSKHKDGLWSLNFEQKGENHESL